MECKIKNYIWWLFWIIYLEIIYRIFVINNIFNFNTLSVIIFSLPWICILSIITSLFKEKINKILTLILSFLFMVLTLGQIVYYDFYNSIFSFYSLTVGTTQVMQFYEMIIITIISIWYVFLIIIIPYILLIIFNKKHIDYKKINIKETIIILLTLVVSLLMITFNINVDKSNIYSLNNLIYKTHAPILTINKTGLNTMQLIDIYRYLNDFKETIIIDYTNNQEEIVNEKEYNIKNIDFDSLINNETNDIIKNMHKYFKNVVPSEKNEYTGIFKNKNLIFITAEAFDTIAIDKEITPTLYKMANNSFIFTNYYQPLYPVSTSDGEYMNLTGLIPKEGVWSLSKTSNIHMPYGIGNIFKNENYITYAFHNYKYKYYDRNKSHPNLGFNYIGCGNGLEKHINCNKWPNSDIEMFNKTTDYYINKNQPFMTYYLTVSGHLNYNFYGNNMAEKHKKEVENLGYSEEIKAYFATQIELDKSMEYLLNELEKNNLLKDTLIIIAPDHYPYGLTEKQINEVSKINRDDKFELYHTSLIMYNPTIKKTIIDKTISSIDILPTIYNLYGLEFDSRLFIGNDIFSEQEHIVILSDRSWITDKGKYNSVNSQFIKTTKEELEENYIDKINKIVNEKYKMSSLIIDNDYYSKVEGK